MKFHLGVDADKRNIGVSLNMKKEDGELDFFEGIANALEDKKLLEAEEDDDIIDEVEED